MYATGDVMQEDEDGHFTFVSRAKDLNPPVHAWAVWHVYGMDKARTGTGEPASSWKNALITCRSTLRGGSTGPIARVTTFLRAAFLTR